MDRWLVLDDFDAALGEFDAAARRLREELERQQELRIAGPAAETAIDIVAFSGILRETYIVASDALDAETAAIAEAAGSIDDWPNLERLARVAQIHGDNVPHPDVRRLLASYKAWCYFMRIYQDWLYAALMGLITGSWPRKPLMKKALDNPDNPVRTFLDDEASAYIEWSRDFADLRNSLKNSIPAHTRGAEAPDQPIDYGLGLTDETGNVRIVRLRTLTEALRRTAEAADVAARHAQKAAKGQGREDAS